MRAIFDTNIYITYLISRLDPQRAVVRLVDAALSGAFTLVVPAELVVVLRETIAKKPHLSRYAGPEQVEQFLSIILAGSEMLPVLSSPLAKVTRDPEDDYLLAACVMADVDVLVTGDLDLLVLRDRIKRPAIMRVADFIEMIESDDTDQV